MKKLNKKGFTLIELLAVIVILAILITVSVPAVTKYLNGARKDTFVSNVQSAISAVRTDVISSGITSDTFYSITASDATKIGINDLLESGKGLIKSTYGNSYVATSFIQVTFTDGVATYSACMVDSAGNGIIAVSSGEPVQTASTDNSVPESSLSSAAVVTGKGTLTCTYATGATERAK
jgi:prepilin-type N-terminal cleavage/methylation domain-containing protein